MSFFFISGVCHGAMRNLNNKRNNIGVNDVMIDKKLWNGFIWSEVTVVLNSPGLNNHRNIPLKHQFHARPILVTWTPRPISSIQTKPVTSKISIWNFVLSWPPLKSQWKWGSTRIRKRVSKFKILSPRSSRRIERLWRNSACNHGKCSLLDCLENQIFFQKFEIY